MLSNDSTCGMNLLSIWTVQRSGTLFPVARAMGRYEFHGKGRDLYHAVILAQQYMPKGYVEVEARDFIEDPDEYGVLGRWILREVGS